MSNLRLFEPALSDPFESMFRRFMAPIKVRIDGNPVQIDAETKATAKYEDGLLTLELPNKVGSISKRLAVH